MGNQKSNITVLEDEKNSASLLGDFSFYSKNCHPRAEPEQAVLQCSGQFQYSPLGACGPRLVDNKAEFLTYIFEASDV